MLVNLGLWQCECTDGTATDLSPHHSSLLQPVRRSAERLAFWRKGKHLSQLKLYSSDRLGTPLSLDGKYGTEPDSQFRNGSGGRQTFAGDSSTEQWPFIQARFFQNGRGTQPVSIRAMTLRPGRVSTLAVFCRCVLLQRAIGKRFVQAGCSS